MNNRSWKNFAFKMSSKNSPLFGLLTFLGLYEIIIPGFPLTSFSQTTLQAVCDNFCSTAFCPSFFSLFHTMPLGNVLHFCGFDCEPHFDDSQIYITAHNLFWSFSWVNQAFYLDYLEALKVQHTLTQIIIFPWPFPHAKYSPSSSHFVTNITVHLGVYASNFEVILHPFSPIPEAHSHQIKSLRSQVLLLDHFASTLTAAVLAETTISSQQDF